MYRVVCSVASAVWTSYWRLHVSVVGVAVVFAMHLICQKSAIIMGKYAKWCGNIMHGHLKFTSEVLGLLLRLLDPKTPTPPHLPNNDLFESACSGQLWL